MVTQQKHKPTTFLIFEIDSDIDSDWQSVDTHKGYVEEDVG